MSSKRANSRQACSQARIMVIESQWDEGASPKPMLGSVKIAPATK